MYRENIHISLPNPRILDTLIDEKSIKVYNESINAFQPTHNSRLQQSHYEKEKRQ